MENHLESKRMNTKKKTLMEKLGTLASAIYRAYLSPTKSKKSYSQCGEDMILDFLFTGQKKPGFYVDVGCHHPRRGSNTYRFYRKGWRGLLIDMEEDKVLSCQLARPRDKSILAAVSDQEDVASIYTPKRYSVMATISPNDDQLRQYQKSREIVTRQLTSILDGQGVPQRFELLSVDAEGADLKILKGLDFQRYQPQLICVEEHRGATAEDLMKTELYIFLASQGYNLVGLAGFSMIFKARQTA